MEDIKYPHLLFGEEYKPNDSKQRIKVVVAFALVISTMLIIALLNIKGVN